MKTREIQEPRIWQVTFTVIDKPTKNEPYLDEIEVRQEISNLDLSAGVSIQNLKVEIKT